MLEKDRSVGHPSMQVIQKEEAAELQSKGLPMASQQFLRQWSRHLPRMRIVIEASLWCDDQPVSSDVSLVKVEDQKTSSSNKSSRPSRN